MFIKRDNPLAISHPASGHRGGTRLQIVALAGFLLASVQPQAAHGADPQPYKVTLADTKISALNAALRGSSSLVTLQKTRPVGPFALAGRIRAEYPRLLTALESFGYYDGKVTITVDGHPGDGPVVPDILAALPKGRKVPITISVALGPQFTLGRITIEDAEQAAPTDAERAALDLRAGQPALAGDVLAGQGKLLSFLRESGHALAEVKPPVAYLHPRTHRLDIAFTANEGPRVDIGAIHLSGLKHVNAGFVRRRLLVHGGELYRPSKIEAAREDLVSTGVFSDVRVSIPKALGPDGRIPLDFQFAEAKRYTVSLQAGYSTDLGGSAGVSWTDHDVFGNAEELELAALATGLGGTATNGLGYDVYANFTKPDFYARDQTLVLRVEGLKQNLQAYDQTALLARGVINRQLSKRWAVSGGLGAEEEKIKQEGRTRDYTLVNVPLSLAYDSTDLANPLNPATHGIKAAVSATPTYSLTQGGTFFTILQGSGSTYFDLARIGLARPGRSVIAVRGIVASVQGANAFALPPDQRLYAGGSSTIRGYKYQQVGPLFPDNYPIGGTSLDAATFEFRQRLFKSFGVAAFVDAGQVADNAAPFSGGLRIGAGGGARYFTPIGPIRVDVAVPLNTVRGDDKFELYIGLGEDF